MKAMRAKSYEWPILWAIFLDLIGFGMAFPDIQLRAEDYGAVGWQIGLLQASYFIVQLIASPLWGRWSDKIGRKPILLGCTALSALSMVAYALIPSLWGILASRILAGLAAANVVVGQAYIADRTAASENSAAMGRVNAAILMGLVAGPAIGGWIADHFGHFGLGFSAATASAASFLWLLIGVPFERPATEQNPGKKNLIFNFSLLNDFPKIRRLVIVATIGWFVLACLEGTFGRLVRANLGFGRQEVGIIFSYESLLGAGVSSLIAVLAARFSADLILRFGYAFQAVGIALMPLAPNMGLLLVASTLYALGLGVVNPTVNSICSQAVSPHRQGELFGIIQASRSIGFIIGPVIGGALFDQKPGLPYFVAAGVALLASFFIGVPQPKTESLPVHDPEPVES